MNKFDQYYSHILLEYPHIAITLPSGNEVKFDPLLEELDRLDKAKGINAAIDLFKRILRGDDITLTSTKKQIQTTTHILLDNEVDRTAFMKEVFPNYDMGSYLKTSNEQDSFAEMFINRQLNITIEEFLRRVYTKD